MPLNKPSNALVLDLINESNNIDLTFQEIEFQAPGLLVDDDDGKNTSLLVTAIDKHGFTGEVTVKYNRLDLADFEAGKPAVLEIPVDGSATDLITSVNNHFGLQLTEGIDVEEIIDLDDLGYVPSEVSLTSILTSYGFIGSIDLTVAWESIDLEDAIVSNNLIGLKLQDIILSGDVIEYSSSVINPSILPYRETYSQYNPGNNSIYVLSKNSPSSSARFDLDSKVCSAAYIEIGIYQDPGFGIPTDTGKLTIVLIKGYNLTKSELSDLGAFGPTITLNYQSDVGYHFELAYPGGVIWGNEYYCLSVSAVSSNSRNTDNFKIDLTTGIVTQITSKNDQGLSSSEFFGSRYVVCGDYIYHFGGMSRTTYGQPQNSSTEFFRYNVKTDTWSKLNDIPGTIVSSFCNNAVAYEDNIYVVGGSAYGDSNGNYASNKIYRYDIKDDLWIQIGTVPNRSKAGTVTLTVTDEGVLITGLADSYVSPPSSTFYKLI